MTIGLIVAAIMKIDFATAVGDISMQKVSVDNTELFVGMAKMASVKPIYRKKGSSSSDDNERKIDLSLANSVDCLTQIDLTHGGLPKGTPMQVMKQLSLIPQLIKYRFDWNKWEILERSLYHVEEKDNEMKP